MTQVDQATLKLLAKALGIQVPKGKRTAKKAVKSEPTLSRKEAYEAAVLKGMRRKLGQEADIQLRVNVLPFKKWLENGRVVRKGEKSVRGLFHISQTDVYVAPVATEATASVTA